MMLYKCVHMLFHGCLPIVHLNVRFIDVFWKCKIQVVFTKNARKYLDSNFNNSNANVQLKLKGGFQKSFFNSI